MGPYGKRHPSQNLLKHNPRIIQIVLNVPWKGAPPCSPNSVPMEEMLRLKSRWFILSFISVSFPEKNPSHEMGKNI